MTERGRFQVVPVPALKDNYIWVLRDDRHAAVVDPGDARPILDYLASEQLHLTAILATHHHSDHVGGIGEILDQFDVPVYGPKSEPIATVSHALVEGDHIEIPGLAARFSILDIPGHTRAPVAYYDAKRVFCGDTLFACGCGRLFEGTPQQMHESLKKLAALPDDTLVYCAHEYTLANIRFARAVEPGNTQLAERERADARTRQEGRPTVPSNIAQEKATNPFLRCAQPEVIESASRYLGTRVTDPVQVLAAIRKWKNEF
jgi:hydroxyacylglutathione hydrolase